MNGGSLNASDARPRSVSDETRSARVYEDSYATIQRLKQRHGLNSWGEALRRALTLAQRTTPGVFDAYPYATQLTQLQAEMKGGGHADYRVIDRLNIILINAWKDQENRDRILQAASDALDGVIQDLGDLDQPGDTP